MNHLEMPSAFTGLCIDGDQALTKQVIPGPVAAPEIVGGCFHRQVHQSQLRIGAHHRPDTGITGAAPGFFSPALDAKLSGLGYGMESPHGLARADVETPHPHGGPLSHQRTCLGDLGRHQNIADDDRGGDHGDRLRTEVVQVATGGAGNADAEIHPATIEIGIGQAGVGVQRQQIAIVGGSENALLLAVAPVSHATAVISDDVNRRAGQVDLRIVGPQRLTGTRIEG